MKRMGEPDDMFNEYVHEPTRVRSYFPSINNAINNAKCLRLLYRRLLLARASADFIIP